MIGSDILESQVRRLCPTVHLYGHTHIPMDSTLDGMRYIQWPLGYFRESTLQCAPIYNSGPLLVYDSTLGDGMKSIPEDAASLETHWTKHYQNSPRDPQNNTELAPWTIQRLSMFASMSK